MARPTKLTPEVHARFMEAIRLGATYEHAAGYAGIDVATFYRWRNRAAAELDRVAATKGASVTKGEAAYVAFCDELKRAQGEAAVGWLKTLDDAARDGNYDGTWQAHAWKLERRHPRDYGKQTRTELTGADGGPVEVAYEVRYPDAPDDYDPSEWDDEGEA